jgi:hypothetical protein
MSDSERRGIFISRGMNLRLSNLSISIGPDGEVHGSPVTFELTYDLWPLWLRIAIEHELMAQEARGRLEALTGEHDQRHADALQEETTAGMVAIAASMFAIDAFYGAVKARIDVPPPTGPRSRRYALVAETLKRAFTMTQTSSNKLRQTLKEAFRIRDMSVHPTGDYRGPLLHPVMQVGVAVPHVAFRMENAEAAVSLAVNLIDQCAAVPRARHKPLVDWCKAMPATLEELKQLRADKPGGGTD